MNVIRKMKQILQKGIQIKILDPKGRYLDVNRWNSEKDEVAVE